MWLDVANAPVEHVYNVPCTLAPVFPAEQVGIGRREEQLEIARRTAEGLRLEGGNDLVYQPLIRARLGMLDMEWFKNEVRYCLKPNGVANLRVRQIGGRYKDSTDFDFMMDMGIWIESLSLPAVLNECLLQSYTGTMRLFPESGKTGPRTVRRPASGGCVPGQCELRRRERRSCHDLEREGQTSSPGEAVGRSTGTGHTAE